VCVDGNSVGPGVATWARGDDGAQLPGRDPAGDGPSGATVPHTRPLVPGPGVVTWPRGNADWWLAARVPFQPADVPPLIWTARGHMQKLNP
jgi:hypothetical protein